jgi:hypothetical protein
VIISDLSYNNTREKSDFSFGRIIEMSSLINLTPQTNFSIQNLRQEDEVFYNSKQFAQNQLLVLGASITAMEKAFEEGQQQLKDAINGLS